MAKINRCSPIKERVRRFGKRIDFLPFFPRLAAQGKNPRYGADKKIFLFFNVDMRLGRVFFFRLKNECGKLWSGRMNVLILGLPIARIFRRKIAVNFGI